MIKSFIYLDPQKMYSLSSQIFEGITEYILNEKSHENSESESQKGPVGSGRVLADAMITAGRSTEKKFLHDYSFSVFEKHLEDTSRILTIDQNNIDISCAEIMTKDCSFLKIKARATFNDVEKITGTFSEFNKIGEALANMGSHQEISAAQQQLDQLKGTTRDKVKIQAAEQQFKNLTDLTILAKKGGLYQDPRFLDNLVLLMKYGFSDQFEIHQKCNDVIFTSCLKREFLREPADLLVRKYSRKTEREIVVFGLITQSFSANPPILNETGDHENLKAALINMVELLTNVENSLSGKQSNEIVIDPIAAYFEV